MNRGFASLGLVLAIVVILAAGGGYWYVTQQATSSVTVPTLQEFADLTKGTQEREVEKPAATQAAVYAGAIGDGNIASDGSVSWNIPLAISTGTLAPGTYKITAQLQAEPKDRSLLCDPVASQGRQDCVPTGAVSAAIMRAAEITGESGWFTISPITISADSGHVVTIRVGETTSLVAAHETLKLTEFGTDTNGAYVDVTTTNASRKVYKGVGKQFISRPLRMT